MKAATAHNFGKTLTFEEISISVTRPGEVVMKTITTCVCNTENSEPSREPARSVIFNPEDMNAKDVLVTPAPTFDEAVQGTLREGIVTDNGPPHEDVQPPAFEVVLTRTTISGSIADAPEDLAEAVAFARTVATCIRGSKSDDINSVSTDRDADEVDSGGVINL